MFWTKVTAGAVLLTLAGCGSAELNDDKTQEPQTASVKVTAPPVAAVEWPETFEAPGTVRARTTATLSSRAMGYIRDVRFREGDRVEAGAVVVTLEARELDITRQQALTAVEEAKSAVPEADGAVKSASAQLALAETTLKRIQDLLNKRSVSPQEFDEANARVQVARSGREMAEAKRRQLDQKIRQAQDTVAATEVQLGYLDVKAPFSGRVTARKAEPGMLASPGMPLLELERDGGYRLEVAIPESRSVRAGQSAEIKFDAIAAPMTARVEEVVPEVDAASRSFIVKLALPVRAELRSGLFGRAIFSGSSRKVLAVPRVVVAEQGQLRNVLVAENSVARLRIIRIGEERDGAVEVLSGLTAGDRVIVPRPAALADGQRVEVAP